MSPRADHADTIIAVADVRCRRSSGGPGFRALCLPGRAAGYCVAGRMRLREPGHCCASRIASSIPGHSPAGSATVNSWTREKPYFL
jgi:hypothetical protein